MDPLFVFSQCASSLLRRRNRRIIERWHKEFYEFDINVQVVNDVIR